MDISGSLTDAFLRDIGLREMYLIGVLMGNHAWIKMAVSLKQPFIVCFVHKSGRHTAARRITTEIRGA